MKSILIIITILFVSFTYSQNPNKKVQDSIYVKEFTCEFGTEKATNDFNAGNYNCYSFGLTYTPDKKWNEFYTNYIKRKHGIILKDGGCVITDYSNCYSNTMNELIFEKFGENVFTKTNIEARKLFEKTE